MMVDRETIMTWLKKCGNGGCSSRCPYDDLGPDKCYETLMTDALELLKGQEESIPVSWLKEKLEGHPEIPYAVTDGINNVLDLWEGR